MFKKVIGFVVLVAVCFFGLVGINQVVDKPVEMPPETWTGKTQLFEKAAPVIQESCLSCHSSKAQLPWYGFLPGVKQMIQHNMEEGLEEADLESSLFTPGKAPAPKVLSKIRSEITQGKMPLPEYSAMHWGAYLTPAKKAAILNWISEEQGR